MVKNLPANAEDTRLIPDPGRSHMLQSNRAHVPQLSVLCSRAYELQLLEPKRPRVHAPPLERPLQCEACALQLESSLHSPQLEGRPCSHKYINMFFLKKKTLKEFPSGLMVKGGFKGGTSGKEPTCQCRRLKRHGFDPGVGKIPHGNPLQYSCLENPMDRGACWAIVQGVAKGQT